LVIHKQLCESENQVLNFEVIGVIIDFLQIDMQFLTVVTEWEFNKKKKNLIKLTFESTTKNPY